VANLCGVSHGQMAKVEVWALAQGRLTTARQPGHHAASPGRRARRPAARGVLPERLEGLHGEVALGVPRGALPGCGACAGASGSKG